MGIDKKLGGILVSAFLMVGCSSQKPREPDASLEENIATEPESIPDVNYDYTNGKLLRTLTERLDTRTIGSVSFYKGGRTEINIRSDIGYVHAIDLNNDEIYDLIETEGPMGKYVNNESLNSILRYIVNQNK